MTVTRAIGEAARWLLERIVNGLAATGVNPNFLTFFGLIVNLWAAVMFANGQFFAAGWVMLFAGVFDMVDGRVARVQGRVTTFGAYFDSTIDRYSDLALFIGLLWYYASIGRGRYATLVGVAAAGSVMVSYARARAESLIVSGKAGFWERPERIVLMIIGALADRMAPVLWLLAIGSNITVIHRIIHTRRELRAGNTVTLVPAQDQARDEPEPGSVDARSEEADAPSSQARRKKNEDAGVSESESEESAIHVTKAVGRHPSPQGT
jgi:CDP-diacylglycerol--glycerol-3-phosphate 3-phosphatidyltransferase